MKYWFSPSQMAFYHGAFYGKHQLPGDAIELAEDEYNYLISQNHRGQKIVLSNGRPTLG